MAELKLKVSLDTSYLKGQISRLPFEFAGANVSIRPKFDRQTIVNEFRLLNRYISSKKFNIVINTNLEGEIKAADRLVAALGRVQQAASGAKGGLPIGGRGLSKTKSQGGFAAAEIKTLFGAAVQGGLIDEKTLGKTRNQMVAALSSIGKDSIAGLLNGLQSGNADLRKAAQMLGSDLIASFKGILGIASPSREFRKIGEAAGQGFEQGLSSSMADAFDSLERQLGTKLQKLKAQAIAGTSGALAVSGRVSPVQVADVTPRDYARIAGSGPRAALPPGVDRSAAIAQEFLTVMDRIGLAMANFTDTVEATTATMQGLKKVIAALNNRALLSGHEQYRLFAQSLTKGQLPLLSGTASQQFPMLKAAGASPRADALRPQDRLLQDFLARTTKLLLPQGPGASGGRSVFTGEQFREIAGNLRRPQIGPGTDLTVKSIAIKDVTGISESFKQLRTPLLPPAGGTTASARMRQQLSALPPLTAPSIGRENAPLSRAATYSLNKANQLLGLPMGPSSPLGSMGQFPMSGMMGRGSLGQFPVDPMLAVGGASAMGQKVAGPYPWSNTTRSAQGGYIRGIGSSLQFPMSGMMGPSSPLGRITPQSSMFAGGGGGGPGGGGPGGGGLGGGGGGPFGGMQFNVPNLPGAGLVREIGTEFGFAAKQVLLFGTAYKALAFIQGFPAQVGAAVGALQSFRNTLGAISPSAEEAAESSQFILDVVDKYNTPIQSARDGFTKLYASMKPTGFSGDEIRDLFLGISQGAATFGMSAEKVDRVNYAFAQMASKGQVMSEELKGQLGDVLPGAMGIFAEAAGFEGPDAITKFSKALEDGAYKGAAMKTLLVNVTSIMQKEFGPGAEGAARTFQGVMNRMQNSAKLLYEAFEPVAVGFLNSVVMPLTSGLKTVTDGFNAFFTGANAQTAGGFAFAQELEKLRPTFEGLRTNAMGLVQVFGEFAKAALSVGNVLLQIAGNPIVGFMAKIYAIIVPLNMALGVMRGLWALNSLQLLLFNARVAMGVPTLSAFRGMMQATGATAAVTATSIRTAGLTLRTFFASTGVGLILVGISLLIERFMSMNQTLADTKAKALGAADAIRGMSQAEARQAENQATRDVKILQSLQQKKNEGKAVVAITKEERDALERAGVKTGKMVVPGQMAKKGSLPELLNYGQQAVDVTQIQGALSAREGIAATAKRQITDLRFQERQTQQAPNIAPITGVAGDGKGASGGKVAKERESQIPQLTLALEKTKELSGIEMQIVNAQLMNNTAQLSSLELLKQLVEFKYEAKALALEDLTTEERALKYKEIGLRREQAIFENQLQLQINLKKERDEIQQGFAATLAGYQEEANYQQMYLDLINQGILPSLAKVRVEAEKAFAEGEKKLDQSIEQIELNIAGLELTIEALKLEKNLTPEKQKQLEADEKRLEILKEDLKLRGLLKDTAPERKGAAIAAGERALAPKAASEYIGEGLESAEDRLEELMNTGYQVVQAANAIGDAFGEAFKGVITGSMTAQEALAGMFRSIADHFADMVAQMIAEYLKMQAIGLLKTLFNVVAPALGAGLSSGFSAGTSSAIDTGAEGWASAFATPLKFANGGIASGGFTAFANGGMVTGPTMGLVGEGRYNEAIIPLPDGKSVPVQLSGGAGGNAAPINTNIVVNVKNGQAESQMSGNQGNQLARELEGAVRQVILKESRPGGLISSSR